jgi:hypothetical protein
MLCADVLSWDLQELLLFKDSGMVMYEFFCCCCCYALLRGAVFSAYQEEHMEVIIPQMILKKGPGQCIEAIHIVRQVDRQMGEPK